jgi:hypothetical protein
VNVKAGQCVGTHAVEEESLETESSRYDVETGDAPGPHNVVAAQKDHRQANWIKLER